MRFSDQLISDSREIKQTFHFDVSNRTAVIENLKFLYWCCVAREDLLREGFDTPCGPGLAEYYRSHLEEERGEISILEEDLKAAGVEGTLKIPNHIAMAMIGTQYYLIKHVHPVSLLGYMAVEEAAPTPIEVIEALESTHGKDLFRFLRLHAIKDQQHTKEL